MTQLWKAIPLNHTNGIDIELLQFAETHGFGEIHMKVDPSTGLRAFIAIHNTQRGPALGGCRCIPYTSMADAIKDALRLARGMTYKSAISNMPHGGGKAVLIRPPHIENHAAYFEAFGRFVNDLNGRYITAVDSGTNTTDMDIIARETRFVTCISDAHNGDPSPFTATGVRRGMEAAIQFKLKHRSFKNIHVAIQGVGHVGYFLAKELHELGAKLTVTDIDNQAIARCVTEFNATPVSPDEIYGVACDIFAPCALGGVINDKTLSQLKAWIIAGSANNQLADEERHGNELHQRDILFAPDYAINAGGLIHAVAQYHHTSMDDANKHIDAIYDTMLLIFERAKSTHLPTREVADQIATERL